MSQQTALAGFHAEVRNARQVSHPNVCRVYDIGEVDREHFLERCHLLVGALEPAQRRGEVEPQRRVSGIFLDCLLEHLVCARRVAGKKHPPRDLILHQRMPRSLRLRLPHKPLRILRTPARKGLRRRLEKLAYAPIAIFSPVQSTPSRDR